MNCSVTLDDRDLDHAAQDEAPAPTRPAWALLAFYWAIDAVDAALRILGGEVRAPRGALGG